jgi:uncharacterized protein YbaP (TraB family)
MKFAGCCLGLCLAFSTGCADSKPSTPAIWKVSDADNSLYLLGSFHALRSDDYPLSKAVDSAFNDAEKLVFELPPQQMQSPDLALNLQKAGTLPAGVKLQSLLPKDLAEKLELWLKDNPSVPGALFVNAEPWYVALLISQIEMNRRGFNPEIGLDNHFMTLADKSGKPVSGLEQTSEQIVLFDSMEMSVQLQLLRESLQSPDSADGELRQIHQAWKAGDVGRLEELTAKDFLSRYPELYKRINTDRNQAWLPKLKAMLDSGSSDDVLVVVGTLHLLGPDGVVKGLQNEGYKVERIK